MEIVVVLHNVRSIHNVGSIFRTADAAGVKKIYVCGITPTPVDRFKKIRPDFAKVSLGAEHSVAWESEKTAISAIKKLKKEGYRIFAVEQSPRSVPYFKANAKSGDKIALIFGNEVGGVSRATMKHADRILEIPMAGKKESLNVAVSFGIVVFNLRFGRDTM